MSDNEDFREDLVHILVNGIEIHFMRFSDVFQIEDFGEELVSHFHNDHRLSGLEFWMEDYVIMHNDENGDKSDFGVLITGSQILFRTESGTISNHKNAGRILMATINFVGTKLEEANLLEKVKKEDDESEDFDMEDAIETLDEEEESSSWDEWI
jgi:hypothetical protein